MADPFSHCTPLISAASSGKLRLVRLLVEGGAEVNSYNPRGETALLAACKALRGDPAGPETVKLLSFLLQNKADPNIQDRAGRTALMYACMKRAGLEVMSILLAAGADPTMEDNSGASALVYAINAQHQSIIQVLMDACQARGRDIIIITTEMCANGGLVTRRYLNAPPSPNSSPVSCMSPSDIVLKTGSPRSPEGENIFDFRGTSKLGGTNSIRHPSCDSNPLSQSSISVPRKRVSSEPWLAIHNLACLNRAYEEGMRERSLKEERYRQGLSKKVGRKKDNNEEQGFQQSKDEEKEESVSQNRSNKFKENYNCKKSFSLRFPHLRSDKTPTAEVPGMNEKLTVCPSTNKHLRRNTLPSVTVVPPLPHLPSLINQPDTNLHISSFTSKTTTFLPHPPISPRPSSSMKIPVKPTLLPHLPNTSSTTSLLKKTSKSMRRHSAQLEEIKDYNF